MKIKNSKFGRMAGLFTCLTLSTWTPSWADELNEKTDSDHRSSTSQIEVRVESNAEGNRENAEKDQQQVTIVLDVAGDRPEGVEAAIEQLEKQLKASNLPEELQRQALDALRSKAKPPSAIQKNRSGKVTEQRFEIRSPSGWANPMVPPAGIAQVFSSSRALGPAQKKKIRQAVSEALEQNGVSEQVIDRVVEKVDQAIDEIVARSAASIGTNQAKPPFRIGIACHPKETGDETLGMEIETVFEDSPAGAAGLKAGDRLLRIDDQAIQSHQDIVAAVQKAGEEDRPVRLEATRGDVASVYEIRPHQSAVAELNIEMNQPGFAFPSPAWVMPSRPDPHEKSIDGLRAELREVHKELDGIREMLQKLADRP